MLTHAHTCGLFLVVYNHRNHHSCGILNFLIFFCCSLVVSKFAAFIADKMGVATPWSSKQCSVTMSLKVLLVISC